MSAVTVKTTLVNADGSALTNRPDQLVEAAKGLIKTYIPGIPQTNIIKGIRMLGDEDLINIPCIMLQLRNVVPRMPTTGKYNVKWPLDFEYYVGNENPEAAAVAAESLAAVFMKLFSNNALNTLNGQFKRYEPYWDDSEMSSVALSPVYKYAKGNGPKYVAVGLFRLTLEVQALA